MKLLRVQKARRSVRFAWMWAGTAALLILTLGAQAHGQESPNAPRQEQVQTFFLKNVANVNDLNDIQTDLRNVLTRTHIYGMATENAITIKGTSEELQTAQKLINDLDRPKKVYRVTYTITDLDGSKRIGSRSISLVVPASGKGVLKQGTRVPIVTGATGAGSDQTSQMQYIDVGINLEATAFGTELRTKVEETSVSDEKSNVGIPDPVIGQTMLEGTSPFVTGKPVVLGTIDIPNSTRQQQISVRTELLSQAQE